MSRARDLASYIATGVTAAEFDALDGITVNATNMNSTVLAYTDTSTDFNCDADTFVIDKSENKVGILKSNPSTALDVTGTVTATAGTFTTLASTGNTTIGDASGDIVTVNAGELIFANDTAFTLSGGVNGLNFDANTLSIDAADNRVGIGTAAPSSTMTLEFSHASEAATAGFTIRNTVNANNGIAPIYFGVSNERNKAAIGLKRATSYGVGDLIFAVDAVEGDTDVSFEDDEKMRITSSGNVSINSGQLNVKKGSFAQTHLTSSLILGY